jgi:copper(I)-binding protein
MGEETMKKTIIACVALGLASVGLASCGESEAPLAEAPEGFPGISVTDGRLMLPAVKGNPGAVYFKIKYDGERTAVIAGADVQGAGSSVLHRTVERAGQVIMGDMTPLPLARGEEVEFKPGDRHIMVMDLDENLAPGDTVEVTLTFAGGDKYSFNADVKAAGDES